MPRKRTTPMIGVYSIVHIPSGRVYIGGSIDIDARWRYHHEALGRGAHENGPLQAAYQSDGLTSLHFRIIEKTSVEQLIRAEQRWMDYFRSNAVLFNLHPTAGSPRGYVASDETRAKISAAQIGRRRSEGTKAKIRTSAMGNRRGVQNLAAHVAKIKLTDQSVIDVKHRLAQGVTAARAARETGLPLHTVERIGRGEGYQGVAPHLNEAIRLSRRRKRHAATASVIE